MKERKMSVLVVDDEAVVRDFLSRFLLFKGLEVETAESGLDALKLSENKSFDVAFIDVRMPKMNGLETFRALKAISPDTKYVMMTGYAVNEILRDAEIEGASLSIKKPFDINQVSRFLETVTSTNLTKKQMRILVVDDDKVVLNFFKRLLREHDVVVLETAKEALEAASKEAFDLIFIDMLLKDMNGTRLSSEILKIKPEAEIILITGDQAQEEEAKGLNIQGCFWKPFEIEKILIEVDLIKKQKDNKKT
ncbi:MAG: response regulator [Candidatus Omnitrophota bacterium]